MLDYNASILEYKSMSETWKHHQIFAWAQGTKFNVLRKENFYLTQLKY